MKKLVMILIALATAATMPAQAQEYYEHFSENAGTKHAKRMMKILEDLAENKYEAAEKKMQDMEERFEKLKEKSPDDAEAMMDALRPLPDLAEALMDIAPKADGQQDSEHNAWTAYEKIKRAEKDRHWRDVDAFLSMIKGLPLQRNEIIDKIEDMLHKEVAEQHTVAAYENLLAHLRKNSRIRDRLNRECEQLAYEGVIKSEDIEACSRYLDRFPKQISGAHFTQVTDYRDSLAYAMVPPTEQGMRTFLRDYPHARMADLARKNLYEYAFQGLDHTEKAYRQYVMEFPNSPRLGEARDSMASCAWATAEAEDTYKAYDTYCQNYHWAHNIDHARTRRIEAGRRQFARLSAKNIPDDLRQDSIIATFLRAKAFSIYGRRAYDIHDERVDTVVENITPAKGATQRRVYIFDGDGLLSRIQYSGKGTTEMEYGEEPGMGFYLAMTTPAGGKAVTYTPTFAPNGLLKELRGDDGSRETFEYVEGDSVVVVSHFPKAAKVASVRKRYDRGRLVETRQGKERTTYEYNEQGDVERRVTNSGTKVLSLTTFEYRYNDHGCWTECRQKGVDGSTQEHRTRTYSAQGE